MPFEDWWETVKEEIKDNCDNRMDEYDAEYWLQKAFEAGEKNAKQNNC